LRGGGGDERELRDKGIEPSDGKECGGGLGPVYMAMSKALGVVNGHANW